MSFKCPFSFSFFSPPHPKKSLLLQTKIHTLHSHGSDIYILTHFRSLESILQVIYFPLRQEENGILNAVINLVTKMLVCRLVTEQQFLTPKGHFLLTSDLFYFSSPIISPNLRCLSSVSFDYLFSCFTEKKEPI